MPCSAENPRNGNGGQRIRLQPTPWDCRLGTDLRHITWTPISCHHLLSCSSSLSNRGWGLRNGSKGGEGVCGAAAGCERGGGSFHQSVHPHPQRLVSTHPLHSASLICIRWHDSACQAWAHSCHYEEGARPPPPELSVRVPRDREDGGGDAVSIGLLLRIRPPPPPSFPPPGGPQPRFACHQLLSIGQECRGFSSPVLLLHAVIRQELKVE